MWELISRRVMMSGYKVMWWMSGGRLIVQCCTLLLLVRLVWHTLHNSPWIWWVSGPTIYQTLLPLGMVDYLCTSFPLYHTQLFTCRFLQTQLLMVSMYWRQKLRCSSHYHGDIGDRWFWKENGHIRRHISWKLASAMVRRGLLYIYND